MENTSEELARKIEAKNAALYALNSLKKQREEEAYQAKKKVEASYTERERAAERAYYDAMRDEKEQRHREIAPHEWEGKRVWRPGTRGRDWPASGDKVFGIVETYSINTILPAKREHWMNNIQIGEVLVFFTKKDGSKSAFVERLNRWTIDGPKTNWQLAE
jgi:hypothetical protein